MELKTNDLLKAIEAVLPGTSNKGIIEGADSIVFTEDYLLTYNDRISVNYEINTGVIGAVVAEDLYKIIKGVKDDTLTLELDKDTLLIKSDSTEAGLSTFSDENIISFINSLENDQDFETLPETFLTGLNLCQFSTTTNVNDNLNLHCVKVSDERILSSDRYRCSSYQLDSNIEGEVLIPRSVISEIIKFKPDGYSFKNGWAYFINKEDAILSCRVLDSSTFAEIDKVFGQHKTISTVEFPPEFKEILPEIVSISDEVLDVSKHVEVTIDKGNLVCHLQKEKGWVKKKYKIAGKKTSLNFMISAAFLNEVLKFTNEIQIGEKYILIQTEVMKHLISLPTKD